jgi:hypothetical protein
MSKAATLSGPDAAILVEVYVDADASRTMHRDYWQAVAASADVVAAIHGH